jgi:hypothetical protein
MYTHTHIIHVYAYCAHVVAARTCAPSIRNTHTHTYIYQHTNTAIERMYTTACVHISFFTYQRMYTWAYVHNSMCTHQGIYTWAYVRISVYIYIYIYIYIYTYIHQCMLHTHMSVCTHERMCASAYVHISVCMHQRMCTSAYIRTSTHTCPHTCRHTLQFCPRVFKNEVRTPAAAPLRWTTMMMRMMSALSSKSRRRKKLQSSKIKHVCVWFHVYVCIYGKIWMMMAMTASQRKNHTYIRSHSHMKRYGEFQQCTYVCEFL